MDIVRSNDAPHIGQIPDIAPRTLRADPLTLATVLAHRAFIDIRRGDLTSVEADAHEAIELASDLMGAEFAVVLAVPMAVLAGIERDSSLASLRRLLDHPALREEGAFLARPLMRYSSGVLRAIAGNHEAAIEELRSCALGHRMFGGENPGLRPVAISGGPFPGETRAPR